MSAEQEFEKWWAKHRQKMEPACGDLKAAFMTGRKSGLEYAAEIAATTLEALGM